MSVHVTVKASDAQTGLCAFTVIRWIKFFLGKRGEQNLKAVKLYGGKNVFEEAIKVIDRYDFSARNVP
jgi:hypothetical protein